MKKIILGLIILSSIYTLKANAAVTELLQNRSFEADNAWSCTAGHCYKSTTNPSEGVYSIYMYSDWENDFSYLEQAVTLPEDTRALIFSFDHDNHFDDDYDLDWNNGKCIAQVKNDNDYYFYSSWDDDDKTSYDWERYTFFNGKENFSNQNVKVSFLILGSDMFYENSCEYDNASLLAVDSGSFVTKAKKLKTKYKDDKIILKWNKATNVDYYEVILYSYTNFKTTKIKKWDEFDNITKNKVNFPYSMIEADKKYKFEVRGCNEIMCGEWSEYKKLKVN